VTQYTGWRLCGVVCTAVDGGWSEWGEWSVCSRSCGGGQRTRRRLCDSPSPTHGGQTCAGPHLQHGVCNREHCPGIHINSNQFIYHPAQVTKNQYKTTTVEPDTSWGPVLSMFLSQT